MTNLSADLIGVNEILKQKILFWQEEYKRRHTVVDYKKMRRYVNSKVVLEVREVLRMNLLPAIKLLVS